MKINVFPEHGPLNSKPIFKAFIKSLHDDKQDVSISDESKNADVAVIWSVLWRGRMEKYRKIWKEYRNTNRPVIVLEVGGLKRNETYKVGINGINRDADFANQNFDDKRWPLFKKEIIPWNSSGEIIVICGQHDASEQWKNLPKMSVWFDKQIQEIRKYTTRPILVRPHPRNGLQGFDPTKYKNVKLRMPKRDWTTYDDTDFEATLTRAWAVVNHSSNPAIESVLHGIPVFVSESSLCYDVGNVDLRYINTPEMPNRLTWINKLAYTEWWPKEIEQGLPWQRIKQRLEGKYLK